MYTKIWSKQLLMVRPFSYVFASEEALAAELQVGDQLKVNDGMGINEYNLIGFPTSTTEFGDFTLTVTISKIEEIDGEIFYRANVKWAKSKAKFILPDEAYDAVIKYYGDGKAVNVNVVASENESTIETEAGLTTSNSLYRGRYIILPKVEPLPDCNYRMEVSGEAITANDTPKVLPSGDDVFSLVQTKNNQLRYIDINTAKNIKELLARTFIIDITPSDAEITYTLDACGNTFTQTNGTVHGYRGEIVNYRIVKPGYVTIEDSFTFGYSNVIMPIEMEEMSVYTFVYPNGTFQVGDIVILNDGIGENSQRWTANSINDTDYQGAFTINGEVKEVDQQTGHLRVEGQTVIYPAVNITADQNSATINTFGNNDNADVSIIVDQNSVDIESSAGLETVKSTIVGYRVCEFDSLTGYTIRLECGGESKPFNSQFLVKDGNVASYTLVYNNKLVNYETMIVNKNITRKSHTVSIVPDVQGASVQIYGASTSQIQAYSGQVIDYEVSATDYQTVTDTYTVPIDNISNKPYSVNVHLSPVTPDPSAHYTFDSNGNLVDCDSYVYLEATGTQYINTGVTTSDSNTIDVAFKTVSGSVPTICGTYSTSSTSQYSTNSVTYIPGSNYSRVLKSNGMKNITISAGTHTLRYSSSNVTYDGSTMSWDSDSGNSYNNNLCLFVSKYGSNLNYGKLSINRYKIYNSSSTLVRDLVPVPQGLVINGYTVPSNGMWDIVNQQFYANQGSGAFVFEVI